MLKNHDLGVILAPKMFFGRHRCQDLLIKSKVCVLNLFEIMRVEIPMSRFCYNLAAIAVGVTARMGT